MLVDTFNFKPTPIYTLVGYFYIYYVLLLIFVFIIYMKKNRLEETNFIGQNTRERLDENIPVSYI